MQGAKLAAHDVTELAVERAERLIHHESLGLAHDRPAKRHALPVAAGKTGNRFVQKMGDAQDARRLLHPLADFVPRGADILQG